MPAVAGRAAYSVPRPGGAIDLFLDGNEGIAPSPSLLDALRESGMDRVRRYPDPRGLQELLAGRLGIDPSRIIVTAGADDALDRACRSVLGPGREIVFPVPTFEMFPRYAELAGAAAVTVPWNDGAYPTAAALSRLTDRTGAVVVVSPNNPNGLVAAADDLRRLSAAAPGALLIVDLAYTEFADEDLTGAALSLPNAIITRTLSKAWGLAGLRVGYAAGPAEVIGWMRTAGGPYAVSGPSLVLAEARLKGGDADMQAYVARVQQERQELIALLRARGVWCTDSQGNFVFARFAGGMGMQTALAARGIAVRAFPGKPDVANCLRITCPGQEQSFERLCRELAGILEKRP